MPNIVRPSKPYIRQSTPEDAYVLARTLREDDLLEIWHSSRGSPLDALRRGYMDSTAPFTIVWGDQVVAMFGVVGVKGEHGSPWMLGTEDLRRCWSLLRECRQRVEGYLLDYPVLGNAVWSKNSVHINWIKWLGFQFEGSDIRNGETFLHFHRSKYV